MTPALHTATAWNSRGAEFAGNQEERYRQDEQDFQDHLCPHAGCLLPQNLMQALPWLARGY